MSPKFELTGGDLCLDFANTVDHRHGAERTADNLKSYGDLLAFIGQSRALAPADRTRLEQIAAKNPAEASRVLRQAAELREAVYRIFAATAARKRAHQGDLGVVNRCVQQAFNNLQLQPAAGGFEWEWRPNEELESPLWKIAKSAADLLTSAELHAVRECAAETCGWLFLDRSRNHARRWCDMKVCGNRAKAQRHYRLIKRSRRTAQPAGA